MPPTYTVFVLCYGDHLALAKRCLTPLVAARGEAAIDLRVILNSCSSATRDFVVGLAERNLVTVVERQAPDTVKYTAMREAFYGGQPVTSSHIMWFDDDSYIDPLVLAVFFPRVSAALQVPGVRMLGERWYIRLRGQQHRWVCQQPWYRGLPVVPGQKVAFATGGWWVAERSLLAELDYPWPTLWHNGGDVMLGEALRQGGYTWRNYNPGVLINADEAGRRAKSPRRGYHSNPVGYVFEDVPRADHDRHH